VKRHLEDGWKVFESKVIHPEAKQWQRNSMRAAFYAGAAVVFTTLERGVSDGDTITEEDMNLMVDIDAELRQFRDELDAAAARRGKA
jgi:hypothetical protein